MTAPVDVVVAGGGPVGLAAALEACSRGLSVVVVEQRATPVDKACGEGLMPGAVGALSRLGVRVDGRPFVGIRYVAADGVLSVAHAFPGRPGRGVRRPDLHAALTARVADMGVPLVRGRVVRVVQDAARVRAVVTGPDGEDAAVDGSWLLACDGLHSPIRRQLGLDAGTDGRRYGVRRHAAVAPWTDHVEVHWSADAEAYVTPVSDDEVGVAVLGRRGLGFEAALDGFPALGRRLGGASWTTSARGAGPLRQRVRSRVSGRVLLVGDAAGYVDALTGEGLRIGLASAAAAVDAVVTGRPEAYEAAWRAVTRDYRWLTSALVTTARAPLVRRQVVPAAAALPSVFGALVDTLAA